MASPSLPLSHNRTWSGDYTDTVKKRIRRAHAANWFACDRLRLIGSGMSIGMVHRTAVRQLALALAVVALFGVASLPHGVLGHRRFLRVPQRSRQYRNRMLSAVLAWWSLPAGAPILERLAAAAALVGAVVGVRGVFALRHAALFLH